MAEFKESKTYQNLQTAFAGEAQAYTKYMFYASKAKKDGYEQMGAIFEETAENEKEHAKIWFKILHDGTSLTHSSGAYYIPTGAGAVAEGTAKWNFDSTPDSSTSSYAGKTAQAVPAAGGTAVEINQTSTKTNGGSITYVDYNVSTNADQATGIYSDTIVYTATTN